jgi:hypothetical protein
MVNARARRRIGRWAARLAVGGLTVGAVATAAVHLGPTLWELTAPADRLGALVAEAERDLTQRRAPDVATGSGGALALTGASSRATASGPGSTDDARREPFARVGARISVTEPPSAAQARPGETAVSGEAEPTFTGDVVRGQTVYRMNGDVIGDPGRHGDQMVEAGYEYQFGKRGLEKVKLWEVRR